MEVEEEAKQNKNHHHHRSQRNAAQSKAMESPFKGDILKGKVALITGGASGIGFEISTQLGKHGASVALMGRRTQVLHSAVSVLQSLSIPVRTYSSQSLFYYFIIHYSENVVMAYGTLLLCGLIILGDWF